MEQRIRLYTKGLKNIFKVIDHKYSTNIKKMKYQLETNTIHSIRYKNNHLKKIYKMILHYFKDISQNFYLNPFDIWHSMEFPTFTKSRAIDFPKQSILLPLYNIYLPSHQQIKHDIPFEQKKKNIIWRGIDSGIFSKKREKNRLDFVKRYNMQYNIGFSDDIYHRNRNKNIQKYVKGRVSIKDQLQYMFIVSIEGNDFATNLSWIMSSNSVPVMKKPTVETWLLESRLKEWVHYVPLQSDFSDMDNIFKYCIQNLDLCKKIAQNSKKYIEQFLDKEKEESIIRSVIDRYFLLNNSKQSF